MPLLLVRGAPLRFRSSLQGSRVSTCALQNNHQFVCRHIWNWLIPDSWSKYASQNSMKFGTDIPSLTCFSWHHPERILHKFYTNCKLNMLTMSHIRASLNIFMSFWHFNKHCSVYTVTDTLYYRVMSWIILFRSNNEPSSDLYPLYVLNSH